MEKFCFSWAVCFPFCYVLLCVFLDLRFLLEYGFFIGLFITVTDRYSCNDTNEIVVNLADTVLFGLIDM